MKKSMDYEFVDDDCSFSTEERFSYAFRTRDIKVFLELMFPAAWGGIAARILETGVEMSDVIEPWAPRWTKVPPTIRHGKTEFETHVKSCIYRVHDCFHQLFGIPIPKDFGIEEKYSYKRAQMCGEVSVLVLTEFVFVKYLYDTYPECSEILKNRKALLMMSGPLQGKTTLEIALRMDDLLHKKSFPKWAREHGPSTLFVEDYVPMLEKDRQDIDHNWELMKNKNWIPSSAPNIRYSSNLDGLELTSWMINDFYHLMSTDADVDEGLRYFNKCRRSTIVLPEGWHLS